MKNSIPLFIFANWSTYDQIAKRRLGKIMEHGGFANAKIVDAKDEQEVLDLDKDNPGPVTPVVMIPADGEMKIYRGKDIEVLFDETGPVSTGAR